MISVHRVLVASALVFSASASADINVSGSAFVDYLGTNSRAARDSSLSGITPEFALKLDVDPTEHVAFSVKACVGCHGVAIDRFQVEFTPKSYLNVLAGRFVIPFGDYSNRYDQAGHRPASAPMMYEMGRMLYYRSGQMNLGVLPAPYVDNGAMLYGQVWIGSQVQIWYGGYVVGGLKGENDIDWQSMYSAYFSDNNRTPSGGGRLTVTYTGKNADAFVKDISIGVSGMAGKYDRLLARGYWILGIDLSARLGPVSMHAEVAMRRTDINPNLPGYTFQVIDPWIDKSGFYVEAEHALFEDFSLGYRFDGLRRAGAPLPGSDSALKPDSLLLRYTQSLQYMVVAGLFAKASYEFWLPNDFGEAHVFHFGLGGTF